MPASVPPVEVATNTASMSGRWAEQLRAGDVEVRGRIGRVLVLVGPHQRAFAHEPPHLGQPREQVPADLVGLLDHHDLGARRPHAREHGGIDLGVDDRDEAVAALLAEQRQRDAEVAGRGTPPPCRPVAAGP